MITETTSAQRLEAGDEYLWAGDIRSDTGRYASRTVLGVKQHTPMGGALLEVRDPWGTVFTSHLHGNVEVIRH